LQADGAGDGMQARALAIAAEFPFASCQWNQDSSIASARAPRSTSGR
jgi:hypothetical protein